MASSPQGGTLGVTLAITQGLTQALGGGDQPPNKNITLAKNCHDGSLPVIATPSEVEKKKSEDPKDGATTLVPSPHSSPVPSTSATLLQPSSPQV